MPTLMEMLKQSGNGEAVEQMAKQFQLSQAQTLQAMEALTPAFSEALKRNASDPVGFMQFMQALSGGQHAEFFERPGSAMSSQGMAEGNAILGHLFGSKETSRAVAAQAAHFSGLSQTILKQMLPMLAPMILGGLFKQMSSGSAQAAPGRRAGSADAAHNPLGWLLEQMAGGGGSSSANPWGEMLEQMMGGGTRRSPSRGGQADNPLGKIFEEMMGGGGGGATQIPGGGENPLGRIFEEMMGGGQPSSREPEAPRETETPPSRRRGGLEDLFGEMFDTGQSVQNEYQQQMESIFDDFLRDGRKR